MIAWSLVLIATLHGVWSEIKLDQSPSEVKRPGETVKISCVTSGYTMTSYGMNWIRQKPGKGLEWMGWINTNTGSPTYASSFQSRFSFTQDVSSSTQFLQITSLTTEDSAVYFCARDGVRYGVFDYWGKGTMVTVSSATTTGPNVFPLIQCGSGTGDTVTLGCLATGFTPSSLNFKWTKDGAALTDFIKYPSAEKGNTYVGVSQIRVTRQDWENRQRFICAVEHVGGNKQTTDIFRPTFPSVTTPSKPHAPPHVTLVSVPSEDTQALMCMIEADQNGTQSFKWQKNDKDVNSYIYSTMQKTGDSHSAVSVLKVKNTEWDSKDLYTCEVTFGQKKYTKKVSKDPITVTLNQPSPKEIFNNQAVLECVITGKDKSVVDKIKITWEIDGKNVNGSTGVTTSEGSQHRKTSTMTRSRIEWARVNKVSCSAGREDMTPIVQELIVNKGDGSEPTVTVHIPPEEKMINSAEVTVMCLVSSPVLQDYYITWSEHEGDKTGNYVNGINFPPQKTQNQYLVTSVYKTTKEKWDKHIMFNCNVWPAGRNQAMTPHGVSKSQGFPKLCTCTEDNSEEDEFSSLWSTASSFIFLFISSLFYSMIFSLVKMKRT